MRVFVTGASGWIGSAVIPELLAAGHDVVGLARSDQSAAAVSALGATPVHGSLDDLQSLKAGAEAADAVIHLAFKHDFSEFAAAGTTERAAIQTLGDALAGSGRPLLFAAGLAMLAQGRVATENDVSPMVGADSPRGGGENVALAYAERGVHPVSLRFAATVHGEEDHGFISTIVGIARDKGVSAYIGDGANRWPAVNRADAALMVRLALEGAPSGFAAHAVGEEGISTREIAEVIGRGLGLPVVSVAPGEAAAHFGWMSMFFGVDMPASSAITRQTLGWEPTHATLIDDLEAGYYYR